MLSQFVLLLFMPWILSLNTNNTILMCSVTSSKTSLFCLTLRTTLDNIADQPLSFMFFPPVSSVMLGYFSYPSVEFFTGSFFSVCYLNRSISPGISSCSYFFSFLSLWAIFLSLLDFRCCSFQFCIFSHAWPLSLAPKISTVTFARVGAAQGLQI